MAKHQIWNIGKANAEISAADSVINPLLESAKITTIKVDGKDTPASDAPLADKISALSAVSKSGVATQDISELIVSNDQISKKLEETEGKLAIANSSVAKLQGDVARLTADLATSQSSVNTMTASNAELQNRHDAAIRQVGDLTQKTNATNREVSKMCVARDVLDLKLSKTASEDEKLTAADKLPVTEKLAALGGAINAAMNKLGLAVGGLPAPGASGNAAKPEPKGRDRMKASMKIEGQS